MRLRVLALAALLSPLSVLVPEVAHAADGPRAVELAVTLSGPISTTAGGHGTWSVRVRNTDHIPAPSLRLTLQLARGITADVAPAGGWSCLAASPDCSLPAGLAPGAVSDPLPVRLSFDAVASGYLTVAAVVAQGGGGGALVLTRGVASVQVTQTPPSATPVPTPTAPPTATATTTPTPPAVPPTPGGLASAPTTAGTFASAPTGASLAAAPDRRSAPPPGSGSQPNRVAPSRTAAAGPTGTATSASEALAVPDAVPSPSAAPPRSSDPLPSTTFSPATAEAPSALPFAAPEPPVTAVIGSRRPAWALPAFVADLALIALAIGAVVRWRRPA